MKIKLFHIQGFVQFIKIVTKKCDSASLNNHRFFYTECLRLYAYSIKHFRDYKFFFIVTISIACWNMIKNTLCIHHQLIVGNFLEVKIYIVNFYASKSICNNTLGLYYNKINQKPLDIFTVLFHCNIHRIVVYYRVPAEYSGLSWVCIAIEQIIYLHVQYSTLLP